MSEHKLDEFESQFNKFCQEQQEIEERSLQLNKLKREKGETEEDKELSIFFEKNGLNYNDMVQMDVACRLMSIMYYYNVVDKKIYEHDDYFLLEGSRINELTKNNDSTCIYDKLKKYVEDNF